MVKCCVPYCLTEGTNGFHAFPADKVIRRLWIEKTRTFHLDEDELKKFGKVCRCHFKEKELLVDPKGKLFLKSGSIPSLRLPEVINLKTEHNYSLCSDVTQASLPKRQQSKRRTIKSLRELSPDDFAFDTYEVEVVSQSVIVDNELDKVKKMLKEKDKLILDLNRKIRYKDKRIEEQSQKIKDTRMNNKNVITYLSTIFKKQQLEFVEMQIANSAKSPQGQRYTPEQKSLCLALYKQGPKAYRFLKKYLILPSKRTLGRHRARLIFDVGINSKLFDYIKAKVDTMQDIDTYCTICWDEVALKAHLDYNQSKDLIDGFVDFSIMRRPTFATHGLTFMVRGVNTSYKQAVAYFFTDGIKNYELADLVVLVTEAVLKTGLKVIGSICDQVYTNTSAVDTLVKRSGENKIQNGQLIQYKICATTIVHCYDPSHLIKGIRNNLYKKNLKHFVLRRWKSCDADITENVSKTERIASWNDVEDLYKFNLNGSRNLLEKITDEHINPKKEKMKVSNAAQIFSQTYGKVMLHCSKKNQLPPYYSDTAEILIFFNDIFDSMNGASTPINAELKGYVTQNSVHFVFWEYALRMLSKMQFIDKISGKNNNRSKVLFNFESTIRGFMEISIKCLSFKISQISIRNMSQDGLENFFGCLRMYCHNSNSLIACHFRASFVTTILNNLTNLNSLKCNCEPDSGVPLLENVHKLLMVEKSERNCNGNEAFINVNEIDCDEDDKSDIIVFDPQFSEKDLNFVESESMSKVSSLFCQKILQETHCEACRNTIESSTRLNEHDIIDIIHAQDSMKYPSESFMRNFKNQLCHVNKIIPQICAEKSLKSKILAEIENFNIDELGCPEHSMRIASLMKNYTANYGIITFCKNVNNHLSGKVSILADNSNLIEDLAFTFREKKKHVGKFSDVFQMM